MLCEKHHEKLQASRSSSKCDLDNRELWAEIYSCDGWTRLKTLVSFYLSIDAGTCELERNLGKLKHLSDTHSTESVSDLQRALEILLDGPVAEELFERKLPSSPSSIDLRGNLVPMLSQSQPLLLLNDASRELCKAWVECFGRRFHVYKTRSDKGTKRGHTKGSEAYLICAQQRVRDAMVAKQTTDKKLLSKSRSKFAQPNLSSRDVVNHRLYTKDIERFQKHTAEIKTKNQETATAARRGTDPFVPGLVLITWVVKGFL